MSRNHQLQSFPVRPIIVPITPRGICFFSTVNIHSRYGSRRLRKTIARSSGTEHIR